MEVIMTLHTIAFQHEGDAYWGCFILWVSLWLASMKLGREMFIWVELVLHGSLKSQWQFVLIAPSLRCFTEVPRLVAWWPQSDHVSSGKEVNPSHLRLLLSFRQLYRETVARMLQSVGEPVCWRWPFVPVGIMHIPGCAAYPSST